MCGQRNDELEDVIDAARGRDTERFATSAEDLSETEHRVRKMFGDYGFKEACSNVDEAAARGLMLGSRQHDVRPHR